MRIIKYIFVSASIFLFLGIIDLVVIANSPRITSQSHLERVVAQTAKEIDPEFDPAEIHPKLTSAGNAWAGRPGRYYMIKIGGFSAVECTVRHEVYHIVDGHVDAVKGFDSGWTKNLVYFFWFEPQALIYELTGLKL